MRCVDPFHLFFLRKGGGKGWKKKRVGGKKKTEGRQGSSAYSIPVTCVRKGGERGEKGRSRSLRNNLKAEKKKRKKKKKGRRGRVSGHSLVRSGKEGGGGEEKEGGRAGTQS